MKCGILFHSHYFNLYQEIDFKTKTQTHACKKVESEYLKAIEIKPRSSEVCKNCPAGPTGGCAVCLSALLLHLPPTEFCAEAKVALKAKGSLNYKVPLAPDPVFTTQPQTFSLCSHNSHATLQPYWTGGNSWTLYITLCLFVTPLLFWEFVL